MRHFAVRQTGMIPFVSIIRRTMSIAAEYQHV